MFRAYFGPFSFENFYAEESNFVRTALFYFELSQKIYLAISMGAFLTKPFYGRIIAVALLDRFMCNSPAEGKLGVFKRAKISRDKERDPLG